MGANYKWINRVCGIFFSQEFNIRHCPFKIFAQQGTQAEVSLASTGLFVWLAPGLGCSQKKDQLIGFAEGSDSRNLQHHSTASLKYESLFRLKCYCRCNSVGTDRWNANDNCMKRERHRDVCNLKPSAKAYWDNLVSILKNQAFSRYKSVSNSKQQKYAAF